MIYNSYGKGFMKVDDEGSYFMPDYFRLASDMLFDEVFCTEVNEINALRDEFIEKGRGKVFIDVGAHIGTYTIVLGKVFDRVFAFEPEPHIYNILCANIALHNLSYKSVVMKCPVSDCVETLRYVKLDRFGGNNYCYKDGDDMWGDLYSFCTEREELTQNAMPLDALQLNNVGLLKIDVEGFELNVLRGATQTLKASNYPPIIIESWNPSNAPTEELRMKYVNMRKELFDFVNTLGYKISQMGDNDILFRCDYER